MKRGVRRLKLVVNSPLLSLIILTFESKLANHFGSLYGLDLDQRLLVLRDLSGRNSHRWMFVCSKEDYPKLLGMKLRLSFTQMLQIQRVRLCLLVSPRQDVLALISLSVQTSTDYPQITLCLTNSNQTTAYTDQAKRTLHFFRSTSSWDQTEKEPLVE